MSYAYVILVRPSMEGAYAEVIDASVLVDANLDGMQAANAVCTRMGEKPPYDLADRNRLAEYISHMGLRARFNNAEGPFLVKSEEPIEGDAWDALVRDPEIMDKLRKGGRL